ncbi:MAG: DUF6624 domain-containing protein [Marinicellaceae bacterium]
MNTLKNLIKYIILITFSIALISCQNQKKVVYKATPQYSFSMYCLKENIDRDFEVLSDVTEVLENTEKYPVNKVVKALVDSAGYKVAAATQSIDECTSTFKSGERKFNQLLMNSRKQLSKQGGNKASADGKIAQVQDDITYMWRDDQSARITMIQLKTKKEQGPEYWSYQLARVHTFITDHQSIDYIEKLIEEYDWVDKIRFGQAVSKHAWIMIQHADQRPDLQAKVLQRMEPYLKSGGIQPSNYAYLWDRVAVNNNKKQRYGTQPDWDCVNGKMKLQPMENPETVNQRRAELGMGTAEKSLEQMNLSSCGMRN